MERYDGNFANATTEKELKKILSLHGIVDTVHLVTDLSTRQSKCFASIEMQRTKDGENAIKMLHGSGLATYKLVVRETDRLPCRMVGQDRAN